MKRNKLLIIIFLLAFSLNLSAQNKEYKGDGVDTYLEYTPFLAALTLKIVGVEGASSWKRFVVNNAITFALDAGTVYLLKNTIHETRPDGTDNKSFPSGHSAIVFAGATVLHKEYGKISPWISVAGYSVATFTAVDRLIRNRHHWQDVVVGAALGVGFTELGYWLGDKITGEKSRYSISASPEGLALRVKL